MCVCMCGVCVCVLLYARVVSGVVSVLVECVLSVYLECTCVCAPV